MSSPQRLSHQTTNQRVFELVAGGDLLATRVLDVGAGEGYFSRLLGEHVKSRFAVPPATVLRACDLYPALFRYPDVSCDPIAADGRLPYPDGSFDVACSIEVIEHLEDQFAFARELHRVLKPDGRAIITTPNVLNLNSRVRTLHSGLAVLFDPLPLASPDPVHTSGHIHPIPFYYLGYVFHRAGFRQLRVHYDRTKKSAVAWLLLLAPFIFPARALA
ncbi:MAG TPA: methyltransferase domain-containing protein, partial [Gemmatimonadales bacterium]